MIRLTHPTQEINATIDLPGSKSISNRLLMLQHLYAPKSKVQALSRANDTALIDQILSRDTAEIDVEDAGTVARFLTAYFAVSTREVIMKGTPRMHKRPMGELVNCLRSLGADISYLGEEGYLPLKIKGTDLNGDQIDLTKVRSSQFISALLMIAPKIKGDLKIKVDPSMDSWSFVELTMHCMEMMGFTVLLQDGCLSVVGSASSRSLAVEKDWTSFYYWFVAAVLARKARLVFPGLSLNSVQTESKWLEELKHPLIEITEGDVGLILLRREGRISFEKKVLDLKDHPDLAPTFAILFASLAQKVDFTGLESLQYKECDRDMAIGEHLKELNANWSRDGMVWHLHPPVKESHVPKFRSFDDHRMIMSAAVLAVKNTLLIEEIEPVRKSYPDFFNQMELAGFKIELE